MCGISSITQRYTNILQKSNLPKFKFAIFNIMILNFNKKNTFVTFIKQKNAFFILFFSSDMNEKPIQNDLFLLLIKTGKQKFTT